MRKSKQFISMPVVSLEEGLQMGSVKDLVVNPAEKKVVALAVEQKGLFKEHKYIPYSKVRSVGEDAVTVNRGATAQKGSSLPEIISLLREKSNITGARIVSESGTLLGVVDDYYVNLASGELVGMEFSSSYLSAVFNGRAFLDIDHVITIGKDMVVCSDAALEKAVKLDGGLQERLRGMRESTGQIWASTKKRTRDLGTTVNKPLSLIKRTPKNGRPSDSAGEDEQNGSSHREHPSKND